MRSQYSNLLVITFFFDHPFQLNSGKVPNSKLRFGIDLSRAKRAEGPFRDSENMEVFRALGVQVAQWVQGTSRNHMFWHFRIVLFAEEALWQFLAGA